MPKIFGTPLTGGLDHVGPSPLTLMRDNTDLVIADTTDETALFTYTIPGLTLNGDRGYRVTVNAEKSNFSGGDVTPTIRVKLGATTMITIVGAQSDGYATDIEFRLELLAKNSDAAQEAFLVPSGLVNTVHYGSAAEDATEALDLQITVEMDVADPDASWTHRRSMVESL